MGDFLQHVGLTAMCPHGSPINVISTNFRVKVMGQPVACLGDVFMVAGCPNSLPTVPPTPQPCLTVQWLMPALRVKIMGRPALLKSSVGLCMGSVPPAPPSIQMTQMRVKGV